MTPPATSARARAVHSIMRASARMNAAEPELLGLAAVVRPGDHVFDVGAAYGMYTFPLAAIVGPNGSVNAFEPQKRGQRMLRAVQKITGGRNIRLAQAAVGPQPGEHPMLLPVRFGVPIYGHTHVGTGTDRALTPQAAHTRTWTTEMVSVDSWCETHGIDTVSFMKVDVEGFEPNVLEGAQNAIETNRPSLLLEIEDRHIGRYGRDANAFADEIRARWPEYRMYTWSGGDWAPTERVTLGIRNYLFATDAAFARPTL
ncbi:FkbM family methyltransferase [Homoserinimonas aerilata]|uniref:FkbM family methyltransferase n=1 Tax=Homoserinimonas aerilata TaxID=1162970 RepID=UPI00114F6B43|nr:FkbM family methyltransferase [Homoserinimonas aerilata]